MAQLEGSKLEQEVLQAGRPKLDEPEYDNWDGGTYYYTLVLSIPVDLFVRLGDQVGSLEQTIAGRIERVLRRPDSHQLAAVRIDPGLMSADSPQLRRVIEARTDSELPHFWSPGDFRLFLSHVSSFKQRTAALRQALGNYCISAFVAHETIDPGKLWRREIVAALETMDAMAVLLTPGFTESRWTDQEVGWALGRGAYVLPVRRGIDPYGFLGEVQGIQGMGKTVGAVADEVFASLARHPKTGARLQEALVASFDAGKPVSKLSSILELLARSGTLSTSMAQRVHAVVRSLGQVNGVDRLVRQARGLEVTAS